MKRIVGIVSLTILLGGCAAPLTTREKGVLGGGALGAGAGAIIGKAVGHHAGKGALIGSGHAFGLYDHRCRGKSSGKIRRQANWKQIAASYNGNVKNLMLSAVIVTALRGKTRSTITIRTAITIRSMITTLVTKPVCCCR